jgi:hypothetical protein
MTHKNQKPLVWGLRVFLILFGLVCLFFFYVFGKTFAITLVEHVWQDTYCGLICLMFIPIFAALVDAWLILGDIGRNNSFCEKNAQRLMRISRYALVVTVLWLIVTVCHSLVNALITLPSQTLETTLGIHPYGIMVLGIFLTLVGAAASIAAAALSHLTRKAAAIQDENDLTI